MSVGELIKNRFVLEELIGSGRRCDVYKALDLRRQEARAPQPYIAMKIATNEDYRNNPNAYVALAFECFRTSTINHPNVVSAFDFDKEGDIAFLTMPLLEGQTLASLIAEDAVEDVSQIATGICRALQCVHDYGLLHLNITSDSVFVTTEGIPKLIGFSSTREISGTSKTDAMIKALGPPTHAYASPEMLADEEPSPADDVFSLAVVIYELLSGNHPYQGRLASEAVEEGIQPEALPMLEDRQWTALANALVLKRDDRLQTVNELVQGFLI